MDLFETVTVEKYLMKRHWLYEQVSDNRMMFVLVREIKINSDGI